MDSIQYFQVAGFSEHPAIGSLSLRERARVRAGYQAKPETHKHRISLVLPKDRWQTANPFTPFVLRLYANVF